MITEKAAPGRSLKKVNIKSDLIVAGGGMAGVCCAITAARKGIRVVLVQDRPVLGGNASSEVRLWILGATSHMGNNNRWAREGGVINELLTENMYRNPEGNTVIFDTILLEKVWQEPNITLLLNTAVFETHKSSPGAISGVSAFCSQNSTLYELSAPLFCDASGDGIVGFQAGAAFRMGAESAETFDEPFAPTAEYGELLGHSLYFMSKDLGKPVKYVAPAYALKDITRIPRYRKFNVEEHGCWLWWIEYGGRLDTVHETETIKWELWKVVYGVWDYIKNSGNFPEAENLTLEWVGQIPGKRESRRFEGHYMLTQSDIVGQVHFKDAVAHGGWAIDLHPADGIFSEKPGCNQWHSKGVYEIPYRCMISRNIENLFLAGRIISASHVAFGSTRVMATCAHNAQAVGMAAALAVENNWKPADLLEGGRMKILQQELLKTGQHIPHRVFRDKDDLLERTRNLVKVAKALSHGGFETTNEPPFEAKPLPDPTPGGRLRASSRLLLSEISFDGEWRPLIFGAAQLLPLAKGPAPVFEIAVGSAEKTQLTVSLRKSSKAFNYTPDKSLGEKTFEIGPGRQRIEIDFETEMPETAYAMLCVHQNEAVSLQYSNTRITGLVSVFNKHNKAVSNFGRQDPDPSIGFEAFEFWVPVRRPEGQNIAMKITPGLNCFGPETLLNGFHRPYLQANAWVASPDDPRPELSVEWPEEQSIQRIILNFDPDWDHAMESSLLGHAERVIPFTVRDFQVQDQHGEIIHEAGDNYQGRYEILLETPVRTNQLTIQLTHPSGYIPAALFGLNIYPPQ